MSGNPDASSSGAQDDSSAGRSGPVQSTRSYMYLESAGSMMYEKDGQWLLEKLPPYLVSQGKGKKKKAKRIPDDDEEDQENDNVEYGPCGAGNQMDLGMILIDTLTSSETNPCNLCDKPRDRENDIAPLWTWIYNMVVQIVGKAKEIKKDMVQKDVSCGESEHASGVSGLVSSKGTQSSFSTGESIKPFKKDY